MHSKERKNDVWKSLHHTNSVSILFNVENVVTRHTELFWNVDFDKQTIGGEAILHFDIVAKEIERIVSMR